LRRRRGSELRFLATCTALLACVIALHGNALGGNFDDMHLPDHVKTPGAVATTNTETVCAPGYAHRARQVLHADRGRVYLAYGIPRGQRRGFVIDHLIPLEIGGSNDVRNLWPQPRTEAKAKNRVEDAMHEAVCSHRLPIRDAQERFARDWRIAIP